MHMRQHMQTYALHTYTYHQRPPPIHTDTPGWDKPYPHVFAIDRESRLLPEHDADEDGRPTATAQATSLMARASRPVGLVCRL